MKRPALAVNEIEGDVREDCCASHRSGTSNGLASVLLYVVPRTSGNRAMFPASEFLEIHIDEFFRNTTSEIRVCLYPQ